MAQQKQKPYSQDEKALRWQPGPYAMARFCGFKPSMARLRMCGIYLELLRQQVLPWAQRTNPEGKYVFWHRQDHPGVVGGILDFRGLAAIFARLKPCTSLSGSFYWQKARQRLTLIWTPYISPLLLNGTGLQQNTSTRPVTHSARRGKKRQLHWIDG